MRTLAIFGIVVFLSACSGAGSPGGGSVSVNPPQRIGALNVSPGTEKGPYLYGSTYLSSELSVYSESSNQFAEQLQPAGCANGGNLNSLTLSPDRSTLYVAEWCHVEGKGPNRIGVVDTASNQFVAAMPVPYQYTRFFSLTPNADGSVLYAYLLTNESQYDILGFFNTSSHTLAATLQMPSYYMHQPAIGPKNGLIYAAGYRYGSKPNTSFAFVDVVDPVSRKVRKSFSLGGNTSDADGAAFDPSGSNLYVHYDNLYFQKYNPNEIRILNPSTGAQKGVIYVPVGSYGVTGTFPDLLISAEDRLYIVSASILYVYDLATRSKIAAISIPTPVSDSGMAFNAAQSEIYLSSRQYIYVIDTASHTITNQFVTAPNPPQNTQVWLAAQ